MYNIIVVNDKKNIKYQIQLYTSTLSYNIMLAHAFNNGVVLEILCNVPTYLYCSKCFKCRT